MKNQSFDVAIKDTEGNYYRPTLEGLIIRSLSTSSINDNVVFAGIKGGKAGDGKVAMSMDHGKHWTYLNKGLALSEATVDVQTIEQSPHDKSIIYAGTWKNGLYKSIDGGNSFKRVENFPSKDIRSILFNTKNINEIIVATTSHGVVSSFDKGENWVVSEEGQAGIFKGIWKFEQSIHNENMIYALTFKEGLYKSMDFGKSWVKVLDVPSMIFALGWKGENILYCSTTNGKESFLYKSIDSGNSFEQIENKNEDLMRSFLTWNDKFYIGGQTGLYELHNEELIKSELISPFRTCLLYTSPSPRDATLSRMPSSA